MVLQGSLDSSLLSTDYFQFPNLPMCCHVASECFHKLRIKSKGVCVWAINSLLEQCFLALNCILLESLIILLLNGALFACIWGMSSRVKYVGCTHKRFANLHCQCQAAFLCCCSWLLFWASGTPRCWQLGANNQVPIRHLIILNMRRNVVFSDESRFCLCIVGSQCGMYLVVLLIESLNSK